MYDTLYWLVTLIGVLALVGMGYCLHVLVQHARAYWSPEQVDNRLDDYADRMGCYMEAESERRAMGESIWTFYGESRLQALLFLLDRRLFVWWKDLTWAVYRWQNRRQAQRIAAWAGTTVRNVWVDDNFADPKHLKGDAPCSWCGAKWVKDYPGAKSGTMDHEGNCFYVFWTEQEALDYEDAGFSEAD